VMIAVRIGVTIVVGAVMIFIGEIETEIIIATTVVCPFGIQAMIRTLFCSKHWITLRQEILEVLPEC